MSDSTFKILVNPRERSVPYQEHRAEWDRRGAQLDPSSAPLHLDIETVATCDLKCGSTLEDPMGFCNVWMFEDKRTEGFEQHRYKRGFMDPDDYDELIYAAAEIGVQSVKLNYRGEPTLHPEIVDFVAVASGYFPDVMMNTNGNGGARKNPNLFTEIVEAGITNLMFSVDACTAEIYHKQRVGGDWIRLLASVSSAVRARDRGKGSPDLRIRASAVRTNLNARQIDSGELEDFWVNTMKVDWVSMSHCYFPAGAKHPWVASTWEPMSTAEFQCADPFRRMVVTWDLKHTFPCCQGFVGDIDGGSVESMPTNNMARALQCAWGSLKFHQLRKAHIERRWDNIRMCRACPLTHKPIQSIARVEMEV